MYSFVKLSYSRALSSRALVFGGLQVKQNRQNFCIFPNKNFTYEIFAVEIFTAKNLMKNKNHFS